MTITLDPDRRALVQGNAMLRLTRSEFELVAVLIAHPEFIRTRDQLLDAILGLGGHEGYAKCVDAHVKRLRRKLKDAWGSQAEACLRTSYGVGYYWKELA